MNTISNKIVETKINGILIGHAQDMEAKTGVTVVLCPGGGTGGVDVRGGAPGTRETDLLDPVNTVDVVHGITLSGGSAFGLASATGVMKYLEEKGIGFDVGVAKVPIVTGAVIFDLAWGRPDIRPGENMGYLAAENAKEKFDIGVVGGGTGASVGKIMGPALAMQSGIGYSEIVHPSGLIVGALVIVNAFGDIYKKGEIVAGALKGDGRGFLNTSNQMIQGIPGAGGQNRNTTIGAIITNAKITKAQAKKAAQVAQDGFARAICPVHTSMDGDTIFTLATGEVETMPDLLYHLGALEMEKAIWGIFE